MGGAGDDVGIFERVVEQSGCDESGRMGHVDHQDGAHLVGDVAHAGIVPFAAIGRAAADDHLRPFAQGGLLHLVVIDASCLLIQVIFACVIENAAGVDGRTVREVPAVAQVQSHELVARVEAGEEDGGIGLCAAVGLHVGIFGAEKAADTLDGEVLALIDDLTAAVVALGRVALGIFVGHVRAHGLHDLIADKVL